MFSTFVKALIPAFVVGRGTGDGTSYENAKVLDGIKPGSGSWHQ
jgi:hypothetical protein